MLPSLCVHAEGDCCPRPEGPPGAAAHAAGSLDGSGEDGTRAADADDICPCLVCHAAFEDAAPCTIRTFGDPQRLIVARSVDLTALFASEIFRPPLA